MSSNVSRYESVEEMEMKALDDNRARCEFFKHFQFDPNRKIGSVSVVDEVYYCLMLSGMFINGVCLHKDWISKQYIWYK